MDAGTNLFSHCSVGASYRHGVDLIFSIGPDRFDLAMALTSASWTLAPELRLPVTWRVDRRGSWSGTGVPVDDRRLRIDMPDDERLLRHLRRGLNRVVELPDQRVDFRLTSTSRALRWLIPARRIVDLSRAGSAQAPRGLLPPPVG